MLKGSVIDCDYYLELPNTILESFQTQYRIKPGLLMGNRHGKDVAIACI